MPENTDPFAPEPPAAQEHPTQRLDLPAQTMAHPTQPPAAQSAYGSPQAAQGQGQGQQPQGQQGQHLQGQRPQQPQGQHAQPQGQHAQPQPSQYAARPGQLGQPGQVGQSGQGATAQGFGAHVGYGQPAQQGQRQGYGTPGYAAQSAHPGQSVHPGQHSQAAPGAYPGQAGFTAQPGYSGQPGASLQGAQASSGTKRNAWGPALIAGALAGALIGGGTAWAVAANTPASIVASGGGSTVIQNPQTVTSAGAAAAKALPSVATIRVVNGTKGGSGSGIVLDKEGHILTNQHVATLSGTTSTGKIEVMLSDGTVLPAELVGQDPLYDLAVLKVNAQNLTPITWADMSKLNVGDTTVAIGAPLGLPNSVSDGVVSNLDRSIPVASSAVPKSEGDDSNPFANPDSGGGTATQKKGQVSLNVIQTDAAINHGNSGGALVNAAGELIGVNVAIFSPSEEGGSIGLGFAVRGNVAQRVAQELIEKGEATHGQLGVTIQSNASAQSGASNGFTTGARVATADADSPAGKAGIKSGDVILSVGGKRVVDATDVTATVRSYAANTEVPIKVKRGEQEMEFKVTLGAASVG